MMSTAAVAASLLDAESVPNGGGETLGAPVRALFISDVHLGSSEARTAQALALLEAYRPEYLYLVGDLIDGLALAKKWRWGDVESAIVKRILSLRDAGAEIVYTPGNHDFFLRSFRNFALRLRVADEAVHWTADGRRLLVTHGDRHDGVSELNPVLRYLGDRGYEWLLSAERRAGRWGVRDPAWLSGVKRSFGPARRFIESFRRRIIDDARARLFDGVVCGHIHVPELQSTEGFLYANCGDWVEHQTAIVEDFQGTFQLISGADLTKPALVANELSECPAV